MDIYKETQLKIEFSKNKDIDITVVFNGVELETKTFNNKDHHIEEVIDYILYNENGGCDVFL